MERNKNSFLNETAVKTIESAWRQNIVKLTSKLLAQGKESVA